MVQPVSNERYEFNQAQAFNIVTAQKADSKSTHKQCQDRYKQIKRDHEKKKQEFEENKAIANAYKDMEEQGTMNPDTRRVAFSWREKIMGEARKYFEKIAGDKRTGRIGEIEKLLIDCEGNKLSGEQRTKLSGIKGGATKVLDDIRKSTNPFSISTQNAEERKIKLNKEFFL